MKKNLVVLVAILILLGAAGFGIMVGFTYNTTGYGAISIGTYTNDTTFIYAGLSFPLGMAAGGGMKIGDIYATDLGTTTSGKKIGKLSISWGALGEVGADFTIYKTFGVFAGPALFFNWDSDFIEGKVMWYTSVGLAFSSLSGLYLDTTSGIFYRF